jgi:hypothetical protein
MKSLLEKLQNKEEEVFGKKDYPISSNIRNHLIPVAGTLLARVPAFMPEYTLHDVRHCESILKNISSILPDEVDLNIIELTILIYAVYLHDIGMVMTRNEAEKTKHTNEYAEFLFEFDKAVNEEEILTEFIRRNHVKKSLEYIDLFADNYSVYKINFELKGVNLSTWIKNVILSHAYPVKYVNDAESFPTSKLIHNYTVNIQFLALLLRLGDILDFDLFRTPPFLYNHINPQNKVSIMEWKKHQSIEGLRITPESISFEAYCTNSKVERAVRSFVIWMENERFDTMTLLSNANLPKYRLKLDNKVNLKVRNDGSYIFSDLELNLDYEKVLNILMGTELYDSTDVFIREVLQNSYDACKYRSELFTRSSEVYSPKISVKYNPSTNIFEIEDNGIGMDTSIFENYLLKIGRSYYRSKSFESQHFLFEPISNFGIGILSCFMVSDSIEIESLKAYSPTERAEPIHYILSVDDKFVERKKSAKSNFGTVIRLKLKKEYASKLKEKNIKDIVCENMLLQEIPVEVIEDKETILLNNSTITVQKDLLDISGLLILQVQAYEWITGYAVLYENQHQPIVGQNRISQQCFTLTSKNSNINIAPKWLSHCKFVLDIKPPHKLRLKANRNKVHEDEKFLYLKKFVTDFLIGEFQKMASDTYLRYFNEGRSNVFSGDGKEFSFLVNTIPFVFLRSNGKSKSENFAKIFPSLLATELILLNPVFFQNQAITSKWGFIFQKYQHILLQIQYYEYLFLFADPYLLEKKLIVTGIPGLIFYELRFKKEAALQASLYNDNYKSNANFDIIYQGEEKRIFCIVGNRGIHTIDFHFNDKHPLGELLKTAEGTSYAKRFKGSFKTNINVAIEQKRALTIYTNYDGELHFMAREVQSGSLNSIGILTQSFLDSTNAALKTNLLEPLQRDGFLKGENFDTYTLTQSDFPAWWFVK